MGGGGVASPTDKIEHIQFSDEEIRAIVTVANNAGTYVTSHAYTPRALQQSVRATARLMAEKYCFLTPTLVTYATMARFSGFLPPASAKKNEKVLQEGLRATTIASQAGVTIRFGTDLLELLHFAQSHEFGLRSQVQSPLDILRSATINPACMLGQEQFLGQIFPDLPRIF
ncbi:uncharacterized protein A1O9_10517 [Exophiala aquamarina CBS 119918]|uniref:Amidohydrolase-related domain-containing protein n=1 Tax=Exophiala aquamarina CBS 119918 TaxID=1182545 RepID=A0A072P1I3_9EURO|nr:uncharacterized protein A1O9_10517 [Exophiala aquamarina CBS 119918]KEF53542.1 hypothetical protein A1O9_10517 [Exophiala aquamarina CBS 119918]